MRGPGLDPLLRRTLLERLAEFEFSLWAQGVQVTYALFLQLFSNYETCYFSPLDYNYLCVVSLPSSSAV